MKHRLLFIYTAYSSFVKTDHEILETSFEVDSYLFNPSNKFPRMLGQLVKEFIFLLINIRKYKVVYIWFADYHSLIPIIFAKIFKRKSFLVVGGYDVARISDYNYGAFLKKFRGFSTQQSLILTNKNLCVSNYVLRKVVWLTKKNNSVLIHNCVNFSDDFTNHTSEKRDSILTVGNLKSEQFFYLKGIDTFIETAKLLPQYNFIIVGLNKSNLSHLLHDIPTNLLIVDKVDHNMLTSYYLNAKIYCQLSRSESFGVALAEGMFFGCTPIIINTGGMSEVVGKTGFIVKRTPLTIAKTITEIMEGKNQPKENGKERIQNMFSFENRTFKLLQAIDDCLNEMK